MFNYFKKTYHFQGMVQFFEGKPAICGDSVTWLEQLKIKAFTYNKACDIGFDFFREKYPEYVGFISLY